MNYDMVGVQADDFKSSDKKVHVIYVYIQNFHLKWFVNTQGSLQNISFYQLIKI